MTNYLFIEMHFSIYNNILKDFWLAFLKYFIFTTWIKMSINFHPFWYITFECITFLDSYLHLPLCFLFLFLMLQFTFTHFKIQWIALGCMENLCCWHWVQALSNNFEWNVFSLCPILTSTMIIIKHLHWIISQFKPKLKDMSNYQDDRDEAHMMP
jgi:hypothetical protein